MVVPREAHRPCHRPDFFASLSFEERPRRVEVGVTFVATRTPKHVAVPHCTRSGQYQNSEEKTKLAGWDNSCETEESARKNHAAD